MNLDNIVIVLVEPRNAGNVGAIVRAMTNMGLSDLRLVNPKANYQDEEAIARAHGCKEQLAAAQIFPTLAEAVADCATMVATSHKIIRYKKDSFSAREIGAKLAPFSVKNKVAILFGRENHGLSNEEIKLCPWLVHIPSARPYPSLNISQAAMLVCYELFLASEGYEEVDEFPELIGQDDMEGFYEHILKFIDNVGFRHKNNDNTIFIAALRRIFGRTGLDQHDLNVLFKLFAQVRRTAAENESNP